MIREKKFYELSHGKREEELCGVLAIRLRGSRRNFLWSLMLKSNVSNKCQQRAV